MDARNALENKSDIQPALLIEALLSESKQLQVTSLQLMRESKELRTALILLQHLNRNQHQQLMKQRGLFLQRLSQNSVYQDNLAFLPMVASKITDPL